MKKMIAAVLSLMLALSALPALAETLTVATNAEFPPFEYVEGEEVVGLDIDIAKEIAKDLGLEMVVESMAFDSVVPSVATGKADLAIAGLTVTDERKMSVAFSDTYYNAKQACIVLKDGAVTDGETLKDKVIGVQLGTTSDLVAGEYTDPDSKVMRYNKALDGVLDLLGGKIDAVIVDAPVAKNLVESMQNEKMTILENVEFSDEAFAVAVKKGNQELIDAINATIARINSDGTMEQLMNKYFGTGEAAAE